MYKNPACVLHLHIIYIVIWPWNEIKACISLLPFTETRKIRFFFFFHFIHIRICILLNINIQHIDESYIFETLPFIERDRRHPVYETPKKCLCVCVSLYCACVKIRTYKLARRRIYMTDDDILLELSLHCATRHH